MSSLATPLPLSAPLFPTAQLYPSAYNPATLKVVQIGNRTTGAAGATDLFNVPIPTNTVAVVGASINMVSGMNNYLEFSGQVLNRPGDTSPTSLFDFAFGRGTKSAWGNVPIDPSIQQLQVGITAVDATVTYTSTFSFLVSPAAIPLNTVSFVAQGGNDVIVTTANTSAANAPQTVDFTTLGNVDLLEILNAQFYTSGGTATGNAGLFDGTTRVDYDSTAAVASYAFNMGAKGSRTIYGNAGQAVTLKARFVIGTAGVGNTSTLNVTYRAGVVR